LTHLANTTLATFVHTTNPTNTTSIAGPYAARWRGTEISSAAAVFTLRTLNHWTTVSPAVAAAPT
jgi:hypothetical protein